MKWSASRIFAAAILAMLCWLALAGASGSKGGALLQADKLIILSTTDVKGKTSPCG